MGCGLLTNPITVRLTALSTTVVYHWYTPWKPAIGLDNVQAVMKASDATTYLSWTLAVQYAAVRTDNPGAPSTLGATQTGPGSYTTTVQSIATTTATKMFVRFGVAYNVAAQGTPPEQGDVELQVQYDQCGAMVASFANQVVATQGTTGMVVVMSDWLPTMKAVKLKPAFVINSATSNLRVRLVYRVAGAVKESPGSWTPLGSLNSPGEISPVELTPSIGGQDMWLQIGLEYSSSDANLASGFVAVAVGARK